MAMLASLPMIVSGNPAAAVDDHVVVSFTFDDARASSVCPALSVFDAQAT